MDGDSRQQENIKANSSNMEHDAGTIFQSLWFRHSAVLADRDDWKPLERQFRFVLCSGAILWIIHAISLSI